jgi:hypothetical protein
MAEDKVKEKFEVVEIATKTGLAVKNNETEETLDSLTLLVRIANSIEELKKAISG